jgi:hypothetical protein
MNLKCLAIILITTLAVTTTNAKVTLETALEDFKPA